MDIGTFTMTLALTLTAAAGARAEAVPAKAPAGPADDWPALNAAAREDARRPVRTGEPGIRPFWNGSARAFLHPPAFDFADVPGAAAYRFEIIPAPDPDETPEDTSLRDDAPEGGGGNGGLETASPLASAPEEGERFPSATCLAEHPWLPVDPKVWDALPPGYYTLRVTPFRGEADSRPTFYTRTFYRSAPFHGPYPAAPRSYKEAAARVYEAVAALPQVQGWLESDEPPAGYDLYCYPSKILSSMIRALVRHASTGRDPLAAARSLAIACKMADWLLARSEPAGAPLAHFPPTYWGDRRRVAVENAGRIMVSYPAHAALAYFDLAEALERRGEPSRQADASRYRSAALAIIGTYQRLQGEDGTWPLLVRASDGASLCPNRIVAGRYLLGAFDRAGARDLAARAFAYVERGPLVTWNWDGQFEDSKPRPPYRNLQKGVAIDAAVRLFSLGRAGEALELVRWCEDQFTVWSDPLHHMDWRNWKLPTALEQYDYYTPIDASMADMVRGFSAAYAATGDALWRAKARAMADCLVRHQRADGTIPTYFDERHAGNDWVNCMVYSASALEFAADCGVSAE